MKKDIIIDNKLIKKVLIRAGISGLVIGLLIVVLVSVNNFYKDHYLEFRSPIQSPIVVKDRQLPQNGEIEEEVEESTQEPEKEEIVQVEEVKIAKISAYSCGGLTTEAEIRMNCPSLLSGKPRTATGSIPIAGKTMACDRANLGKQFEINGQVWVCNDLGGSIVGENRFDLYLETVDEARKFGVQYLAYKLVN
jgi:3D (Asp-Asp-Asp) domain-containing protein